MQPLLEFNKALPYKVLILLLSSDLPGVGHTEGKILIDISICAKALKTKALRLKNYLIYLESIGLVRLLRSETAVWIVQVNPLRNYSK